MYVTTFCLLLLFDSGPDPRSLLIIHSSVQHHLPYFFGYHSLLYTASSPLSLCCSFTPLHSIICHISMLIFQRYLWPSHHILSNLTHRFLVLCCSPYSIRMSWVSQLSFSMAGTFFLMQSWEKLALRSMRSGNQWVLLLKTTVRKECSPYPRYHFILFNAFICTIGLKDIINMEKRN